MKDETIGKIVLGSWATIVLGWSGLYAHELVKNHLEDKTAVAKAEVDEGTIIDNARSCVAFDRSGDDEIDEIKVYRRGMVGGRTLAALPYTIRYHKGEAEFERLKQKYFSYLRK